MNIKIKCAHHNIVCSDNWSPYRYGLIELFEIVVLIAEIPDLHQASTSTKPKPGLGVHEALDNIPLSLLNKRGYRWMVAYLLCKKPIVLSDQFVCLSQHWIEWLLCPHLAKVELAEVVSDGKSHSLKRVLGRGCLGECVLSQVHAICTFLEG